MPFTDERTLEREPPEPWGSGDLARLWDRYRTNRLQDDRNRLLVHYAPVVKYVAGRVGATLPGSVDQADLVSYGMLGLIDAIEKFDPDRGFKFETYAFPRIKGAILDELRAIDWVPRSVRAKARAVERAFSRLEAQLHRAPTDTELADELGVSEAELERTLTQISLTGVAALDELVGSDRGDGTTLGDTIADRADGPLARIEDDELKRILAVSVSHLPEREKVVLTLYYYEGLTLAQIGRILGVTESRVCQIHTKAVLHLRARMAAADR